MHGIYGGLVSGIVDDFHRFNYGLKVVSVEELRCNDFVLCISRGGLVDGGLHPVYIFFVGVVDIGGKHRLDCSFILLRYSNGGCQRIFRQAVFDTLELNTADLPVRALRAAG
ncbi:hypothetical protein D3C73_1159250 [compost metagenome]